jgi:hypothetical protein
MNNDATTFIETRFPIARPSAQATGVGSRRLLKKRPKSPFSEGKRRSISIDWLLKNRSLYLLADESGAQDPSLRI